MKPLIKILLLVCLFEGVYSAETKADQHEGKNQPILNMEPPK